MKMALPPMARYLRFNESKDNQTFSVDIDIADAIILR
jgi:hypothetical protein